MMKEKGLRRPSTDLSATAAVAAAVSSAIGQLPTCFENESTPSSTTGTGTTLMMPNSLSTVKFVSNDWCFVDCKFIQIFFLFFEKFFKFLNFFFVEKF